MAQNQPMARTPCVERRRLAAVCRSADAAALVGSRLRRRLDLGALPHPARPAVFERLRRQRDVQLHRGVHQPLWIGRRRAGGAHRRALFRVRARLDRAVPALGQRRGRICPVMCSRRRRSVWPACCISPMRRSSFSRRCACCASAPTPPSSRCSSFRPCGEVSHEQSSRSRLARYAHVLLQTPAALTAASRFVAAAVMRRRDVSRRADFAASASGRLPATPAAAGEPRQPPPRRAADADPAARAVTLASSRACRSRGRRQRRGRRHRQVQRLSVPAVRADVPRVQADPGEAAAEVSRQDRVRDQGLPARSGVQRARRRRIRRRAKRRSPSASRAKRARPRRWRTGCSPTSRR